MWQKASASNSSGNCVEFYRLPASVAEGDILVRNSRFPGGAFLVFTKDEIAAMLDGAKKGEFDHLLTD